MNLERLESRTLLASSISGFVYTDTNTNAMRDAGEKGQKAVRVYLDLNQDGVRQKNEPLVKTSKTGSYTFDDLSAGTFQVRIIKAKNVRATAPESGFFTITTNGDDIHAAIDFGLTKSVKITGKVFNDLNSNGVQDNGESAIPGVIIFHDKNNNGIWDQTKEIARVSDDNGIYTFDNIQPRKYKLRVVLPDGASVTQPGKGFHTIKMKPGSVATGKDFGLI